ncbi:unnamed protein product [Rotaria socialis]|uniref:MIF4G domain-containing protein n=1 Tax=Rotaria socialis TaxID=392032 RepID=A0A818YPK2_9BILA|nr:unnamed protein product [Rotaria socialis]CAF4596498.1 unnamed protein product [Rotaria socialis]
MATKGGRNRNGGDYSDDEDDDMNNKAQQRQRSTSRHHHHHHHHHRSDRRHIQQQNQPAQQQQPQQHQQQQQLQQQQAYDPNKRRKFGGPDGDELTEDKLQIALFSLGQKVDTALEQTLRDLCTTLCNDLTKHKKVILHLLNQCVQLTPERVTIYSTLIGLLHASVITFGSDFIDTCISAFKEALAGYKFETIQRYIRFLSDLVNVKLVSTSSIIKLYETLLQTTTETNVPQVRTDFFVACVLISLPYSGKILSEKHNTELNRLLYTIDKYVYKRSKIHVPILQVWTSTEPHPQEEYLDCLWAQIKRLNQDEWAESQIFRPYYTYADTLFSDISASIVHDLPTIILPPHIDALNYPLPKIVFRMFDYTDVPEQFVLPGAHAIERYLIEDEISNIIHTFHTERKDCAIQLTQIRPKNKIPLNYMIIEVIFGHLFKLPRPQHLELFYGSLLLELCKLQPSTLPPVLAQAVHMLFERLNTMKTSCIERFVKWFSYHLSNFQFTWEWQDWINCLDENPESPKIKFIRETLQRCMRLSFHQRVIDFVPEQFYKLVPNKPSPAFKFEEVDPPLFGSEYAQLLTKKLRERSAADDILRILNTVPNPTKDDQALSIASSSSVANPSSTELTYNMVQIDLFVSSLLWMGSKSFTHSFASLAKYHQLFKVLIETEEQQIQVLKSMFEIWPNHQQMMVVLVDKLVKTQIVECSAVANWIFSSELGSELTNFYIWEILTSTIEKMNRQVDKYQTELLDLRLQLNISAAVQASTVAPSNPDVNPSNEEAMPSIEEKNPEENKMDESETPAAAAAAAAVDDEEEEEKPATSTLKRRHESDDDDENEQKSTEKIQSMQISQPPMDEATAKLHEKYEIVEERLSHAREQQKKLYLIVFQRFIMTLSDFLNECESKNVDPVSTPWLKWIIERLQEIFILYHEQVFQYVSTFESLIFTSDIDFCILEVFQQFCALRA